ncbi:MAG TPA: hypothetical protein VGC87_09010 [Pyrinomonadaceae bacterium]|jgi:hypothetical protein
MLLEDIKILPLIEDWRPEYSLSINSGINVIESGRYIDDIKLPDKFHCGVYRPKISWRRLDPPEVNKVVGLTEQTDIANTLCLVETPRKFLLRFYELKLDQMARSPAHWEEKMKSSFPTFTAEVRDWLEQEIFEEFSMCSAFVNFTRPGLDTTTFDVSQNRYRGMHIDNWGNPPRDARERDASGLRVCLNLGYERRDIIFINLRLKSFLDYLAARRGPDEVRELYKETYAQPLAEDFLNECVDYPVLRVSLEPSQAYIGPVQNIIHDGYPLGKRFTDVNLQLSANEFRHRPGFISMALSKGAESRTGFA